MNDKLAKPPYTSFRSFENLISEFKEHGHLPGVIDRTVLAKKSGSEQSALLSTLKWFGMIDEKNAPTQVLRDYIDAGETEDKKAVLKTMIEQSYDFMTDGSINLHNATTQQMTERFRQYDLSGSTLTKSIAFFLAAAKEAGIQVSPFVKAPGVSNGGVKRKAQKSPSVPVPDVAPVAPSHAGHAAHRPPRSGMITIPIPIFGMQDGAIHLPDSMDERQWASVIKMTQFILQNYRDTMAAPSAGGGEEEA